MEILLVGGWGLTLSRSDHLWDRFNFEDEIRRLKVAWLSCGRRFAVRNTAVGFVSSARWAYGGAESRRRDPPDAFDGGTRVDSTLRSVRSASR